jgi:hypothetical protein
MILAHQRYLAKLSVILEANVKAALPHKKASFPEVTSSLKSKLLAGTVS